MDELYFERSTIDTDRIYLIHSCEEYKALMAVIHIDDLPNSLCKALLKNNNVKIKYEIKETEND